MIFVPMFCLFLFLFLYFVNVYAMHIDNILYVMGVMKIGNIVPRAGLGPTSLAFGASVKPLHHVGSLMSPQYPYPLVYMALCLRGQCRLLDIHIMFIYIYYIVIQFCGQSSLSVVVYAYIIIYMCVYVYGPIHQTLDLTLPQVWSQSQLVSEWPGATQRS